MPALQQKTILVVEDDQALQEALKLKLVQAGFAVTTAGSGEEALEAVKKQRPTLISLDILLPRMNGLEFLQIIRKDPALSDVPVVVLSVSAGMEKIKQAFGLNVTDYLIKSEYGIEELVKRLTEMASHLPDVPQQKI
ncbi:MAG: hypothetical protein RL141_1074 [Candidatus Parcubacteria bacterium]|jgi:CheY-like chemotaxis protein